MSDELIVAPSNELSTVEDAVLAVAGSGGFLPSLQLFGSSSDAVKEGTINIGHWGLKRGKDEIEDLGKEVNILVVAGRVKALDWGNDSIVISYDHKSAVFADISARSEIKGQKCMYGPEFLVYIPSADTYASLFMASKTARNESKAVFARLRKAATLKSKLLSNKEFKWLSPVCQPCTTPFDLPGAESIELERTKFLNPPKVEEAEIATETEGGRER